jgi:amidase
MVGMPYSDQIWRWPATELAEAVRHRKVSAAEAAQAALDRYHQVNPRINAVIECRPEEVLARAQALDARLAKGEDVGLLAGVPITVKVNIDQAGYATTNGVRLQKNLVAQHNSPVVDAFLSAGAIILGRTNTPAFSYRWFTSNQLHGATFNPRDRSITPGGSSGGAAAAVTVGIGHLAHGTDIAGSIRYPAYACGVHGLRPTLGRIAAFNASTGDRAPGAQLTAVSGPIARTIADLSLALDVLSVRDVRDPWWTPAPLLGAARPKRVALCYSPDGLQISKEVHAALKDSAMRLRDAGYEVIEVDNTPAFAEPARLQVKLWMGDGFDKMLAAAIEENDPGALMALRGQADKVRGLDLHEFSAILLRRATLLRDWETFLDPFSALLIPVSAEPPFADHLDVRDEASYRRVWRAQMTQVGLPFMGLPGLTVSTSMNGTVPMGVQLVASRYREDLLLSVGEAIAAAGVPASPIDPA